MPNWCNNVLVVEGTKKDRDNFVKDVKSENTTLDFEKIIPYQDFLDKKKSEWNKLSKDEKKKWIDKDFTDDGFQMWAFNNGGYNWCVDNWGTKWNADVGDAREDNDKLIYVFVTAWSSPEPIVKTLIEKYPNLSFYLEYEETGMCFGGELSGKNGEITHEETYDISSVECHNCENYIIKKSYDDKYYCGDCGEEFTQEEADYHYNQNELADAFADEDWDRVEEITGHKPNNHKDAETIIEKWKKENEQ